MPARADLSTFLLFVSGAAGLLYEVCWSRELSLWLGVGERGAALTLCALFARMGLGYALAAALNARVARPMRAYAACELGLCVCALLMPVIGAAGGHWAQGALLGLTFLASVAMGASLPFILSDVAARARSMAQAYAFHLLGATCGSLLATFWAIPRWGVWGSTQLAAVGSGGGALLAFLTARELPAGIPDAPAQPLLRYTLAAGVVGACTLALEVLALRLFALTFHNSTYTFGLTIAVFIVCLALGSRAAARQLAKASTGLFGSAFAAALGVLLMVPLFAQVTGFGVLRAPSFGLYVVLALGLVLAVLALPAIALGKLLPLLWAGASGRAGTTVGALTSANSLGGALGALLASFVLLPGLGLRLSLVLVAFTVMLLGFAFSRRPQRHFLLCALLVPCAGLGWLRHPALREGEQAVAHWETAQGWLDLVHSQQPPALSARLDLHYQLGSSHDRARHMLMGSLPLALHAAPRRVLFVGLATGMTASAIRSDARVKDVRIVELIPEMEPLARRFAAYNGRVLDDPRVELAIEDGRAYLARQGEPYDVIVSDLFVPWHSHAGYLYTREHYRHVRARLAQPSGVFVQWLPAWQLGARELTMIADTFASVFPGASVWLDDREPDRALLALVSDVDPSIEVPALAVRRLGGWVRDPARVLNTDELPALEFSAPRTERSGQLLTGPALRTFVTKHFQTGP